MNWRIEAQQLAKLAKKSETRIGGMGYSSPLEGYIRCACFIKKLYNDLEILKKSVNLGQYSLSNKIIENYKIKVDSY